MFFCSTINVMSLIFVFPFQVFFFSIQSLHQSLLPLAILLLLPSFMLFDVLLCSVAAVFAFFFSFSQTQWHISIDVVVFESSSSISFQVFVLFELSSLLSFFEVSCMLESHRHTFLSLSLPPPSLVLLSLL